MTAVNKPIPLRKRGGASYKNKPVIHPIEKRLLELGKTKVWLASKIGKTEQTIGNICARRSPLNPGSMTAIYIMRALEIGEDYLYGIYRNS